MITDLYRCSFVSSRSGSWSQIWPVFFSLWFGMPLALSAFLATIFCMLNGR
jgi:hypothetical protein